jgi:hypothetical protein
MFLILITLWLAAVHCGFSVVFVNEIICIIVYIIFTIIREKLKRCYFISCWSLKIWHPGAIALSWTRWTRLCLRGPCRFIVSCSDSGPVDDGNVKRNTERTAARTMPRQGQSESGEVRERAGRGVGRPVRFTRRHVFPNHLSPK